MTFQIAIIGAGYIGEVHAKAVQNQPHAALLAIVDNNQEKAARFAQKYAVPHSFASLEDLMQANIADAVIIGTPNFLHAPQTIAALKAGYHVLVEKPMALSVEEARLMHQVSQETSRTLMIAHCWRYDAEVIWLRNQIALHKLGKIIRTKGYGIHVNWGPQGWFVQKNLAGGGALMDMGIHAIDTVRYLLGEPQPHSVYAKLGTHYGAYDVDDTGIVIINWEGGVTSYIESGWWQPHADGPEAATRLFGEKGYGSVFPTQLDLIDKDSHPAGSTHIQYHTARTEHCDQAMYDQQVAHFLSSIQHQTAPNSNALLGISNMKILAAAYQSSQTGTVVSLVDEQPEGR